MWDAENKKLQQQFNAMKQRDESYVKKLQALQQSQHNFFAGKFTKSWNNTNRGKGKGKGKDNSQQHQQRQTEEHAFSSQVQLDLKPNSGWKTGGYKGQ